MRRGGAGNGPAAASHVYTRNFSFHPMDPFDLFRSFFGGRNLFGGDAFGNPFHTRFHQQAHHNHAASIFNAHPFFGGGFGASIFDDMLEGASSTTTYQTGEGRTVHITRTVIGGDRRVKRAMRFRTPSATCGRSRRQGALTEPPRRPSFAVSSQMGHPSTPPSVRPRAGTSATQGAPPRERGEPDGRGNQQPTRALYE